MKLPKVILFFSFNLLLFSSELLCSQVKIQTRTYLLYEWSRDDFQCENAEESDTVVCINIVNYAYPFAVSSDQKLAGLINQVVKTTFEHSEPSMKYRSIKTSCPEEKPALENMNYEVRKNHAGILSFVLFKDWEPAGLGNGFRHDALPFTFDLKAKKRLKIADLIAEQNESLIRTIVLKQIRASNPELMEPGGEINNPWLFENFNCLNDDFAVKGKAIVLYYSVSYGGKVSYLEVSLDSSSGLELFKDQNLLERLTKTN